MVTLNIGRKEAVFFMAFFAVTLGIGVWASSHEVPNPGHSADSVWIDSLGKTLEQAVIEGDLGGGGGGDGIVRSSLGTASGYIEYESGLIMQWGSRSTSTCGTVTLQIPFTSANSYNVVTGSSGASENHVIKNTRQSGSQIYFCSDGGITAYWFAIGT